MNESIFRPGLMNNRICLVSGGGTGIGYAIARELASLGASVVLCGRRQEPLDDAVEALSGAGGTASARTCDIRNDDDVAALFERINDEFGRLDVLVNNAGGQFPSPALSLTNKGFEAVIRNNLLGTWKMTHAAASRFMVPQQYGHIVNITADVRNGFPGMIHTGAARAGVENLTMTLAIEWAQHGIRVNAVAPGIIATEALANYPDSLRDGSKKATPLRRFAHPNEVAHLAVYLASEYSDFVTGQTFRIDGGKSLWGKSWPIPESVPQHPPYAGEAFLGPNKNAKSTDRK